MPSFREQSVLLGIVGAGNAGTLAAFYGKHLGLTVTLINRSNERLDFLQSVCALAPDELKPSKNLQKSSFDIVLLATSFLSPEVVRLGVDIVKNNGAIVLYGGTSPDAAIAHVNLDDIRRNERCAKTQWAGKNVTFIGTHGALGADFLAAYHAVQTHPEHFPLEHLITRRIGLEDLPALLTSMSQNPDHCVGKAVVNFK